MFAPFAFLANVASEALLLVASASPASPAQVPLDVGRSTAQGSSRFYDVQVCSQIASSMSLRTDDTVPRRAQAHRGGRGNTVENTLPSFAW